MALAGRKAQVKISGTATTFTGETTTTTDDQIYQIDDTTKRVWDRTATITVYEFDRTELAEVGTDSTTIVITGHGLNNNDLIFNSTRSAARVVTVVDANTLSVSAVTGQTDGDSIDLFPVTTENFGVNRLTGTIKFQTADATRGNVRVTGQFLPMSNVTEAFEYSYSITATNEDATIFGNTFIAREQALDDFTGSISDFFTDSTLADHLRNADFLVLELFADSSVDADIKAWVLFSTDTISQAVDTLVDESIDFEGTQDQEDRTVSLQTIQDFPYVGDTA